MKNSKKRLMSLFLSFAMVATTVGSSMPLTAKAEENAQTGSNSATLIASFNFDTDETGFTGAGATATKVGNVSLSETAVQGKAVYLDGGSYLSVAKEDGSSIVSGLTSATVSYVRKYEGGTGWTFYAAPTADKLTWEANGNHEFYVGFIDKGTNVTVERFKDGRGNGSVSGAYYVDDNANQMLKDWQMVTVVLDEGKTRTYINGELVGQTGNDTTEYSLAETFGDNGILQIGKANWKDGEYFKGYLDDLKLYSGTLSEEEIKASYNAFFKEYLQPVSDNTQEGESEDEKPTASEALTKDAEALSITNASNVRGNITLPTTGANGSTITWKSSNPEVVSDTAKENDSYASTPAGVVTRGDSDTVVTLTATLSNGDEEPVTKEINVTVKAKANVEATTDYLFAYFTGNTVPGENIYFAASQDGLKYKELNDSNYVLTSELGEKGIRDPYIMRSHEGDKFYIIATDLSIGRDGDWGRAQQNGSQAILIWESDDLVNWSETRRVVLTDTIKAGCTWAPEAYYDEITGEYVVFWASKVAPSYNLQRIYYSKTRDFVTFTEPEIWIDRKTASTIDTTVIAGNDGYLYRISKNEGNATLSDGTKVTGSTVYMERSTSLFGEWTKVSANSLEAIEGVEGPTSYKLNADDAANDTWVLLLDHFGKNGYAPVVSTDLASGKFTSPSSYKLPSAPRHGTVLNITAKEYEAVTKAYKNTEADYSKYLYYIDSNTISASKYIEIKDSVELLNNTTDQIYSDKKSWGYVYDEGKTSGTYDSNTDDMFSNGYYAKSGYDCEYIVTLPAGEYTATGYYHEWWGCNRPMKLYVKYTDKDGKEVVSEKVNVALSGSNNNIKATVSFKIENVADDTKVHVITTKAASGNPDPVISGLSIEGTPAVVDEPTEDVRFDMQIKLNPSKSTKFNDTNSDTFGEFQGWGTSLCWWANRLGYSEKLTNLAAKLFFSEEGLNLNIGRYNIGGGDCVGEVEIKKLEANEKADFYDLTTNGKKPTYAGSNMSVSSVDFSKTTYNESDADFGLTKGLNGEKMSMIGWINKLDDSVGSGDNLHYTVNADTAGKYTFKFLITLTGTNKRDIAIRVNGKDYVCDTDAINKKVYASNGNNKLYIAEIKNVELNKGNNTVNVGGKKDWTLDFIKMAVIKAGDEGVLPVEDETFMHASHITRSDSVVPGYCTDVTKMDLKKHDLSYYKSNFARADEASGYAWNYDWDADNNQVNILEAAAKASGDEFIAEAFSNSPPYFMTVSGCTSGSVGASSDNLREDCVTAFACYMADVIEHINNKENGVKFQSTTAMNEPYTNFWPAYSNKQEGCHFDIGESQSRIIVALNNELKNKGIDIIISASDETSIDTAISSYNALSDEAKKVVTRIDTHSYSGTLREELSELASKSGENLWMSEVDGSMTGGSNAGEMSAALGLGNYIVKDIQGLDCTAWILWNAVDMHVDANNKWDSDSLEALNLDTTSGYWGVAIGDHNNEEIVLTKKYYGYGQFTRYIRPGMTIIGSNGNTLAAYDQENKQVVLVAINGSKNDKVARVDLTGFDKISKEFTAIRTSGSLAEGENWADVSDKVNAIVNRANKEMYVTLKANSITTFILDASYTGKGNGSASDAGTGNSSEKTESILNYSEIEITEDMISGSIPWEKSSNTVKKLIDGSLSTFFDGVEEGYAVVDLGKSTSIAAISYGPREGYESRMNGGMFWGSEDGEHWSIIYEIDGTPSYKYYYVFASNFDTVKTSFRYIKYTPADGECANISELRLYTDEKPEGEKEVITYSTISGTLGDRLYDTNGNLIQAHGGQIQQLTVNGVTKWYWIGEDKTLDYTPCPGVHMYSSTDLYNWDDEGLVLKTMTCEADFDTDYFKALYGGRGADGSITAHQKEIYIDLWSGDTNSGCVIERPKLLYNEKNNNYVLFFHADGKSPYASAAGANYGKAKLGIAVSDTVNGPYKLLGTYLMHTDTGYEKGWDAENGHARDMNVFKDDDGTAYVMYSSDGNANMYIAKLNEDYTGLTYSGEDGKGVKGVDYTVNFVGASREAPAMFKRGNKYYMISSGCTGWNPNAAKYAVADSVLGPWTLLNNPCVDEGKETTYDTQSTCVVKVGEDKYMYMGDRWNSGRLRDSRYVWLPIEFTSDGSIKISAYKNWTLDVLDTLKPFDVKTKLPETILKGSDGITALPGEIEIQYEGSEATQKVAVTWDTSVLKNAVLGTYRVKGTLATGRTIDTTVNLIEDKLIYFFDCGAETVAASNGYFESVKNALGSQLKNTNADQAYSEENGAGYLGTIVEKDDGKGAMGVKDAGSDIWAHGFWACANKNIEYNFKLEKGTYKVALGSQEWWTTTRYNKIVVSASGKELATKTYTLSSNDTENVQTVEFTLDEDALVTVSLAKTSGNDPVLSWIGVIKTDLVKDEPSKDESTKDEPTKPSKPSKPSGGNSGNTGNTGGSSAPATVNAGNVSAATAAVTNNANANNNRNNTTAQTAQTTETVEAVDTTTIEDALVPAASEDVQEAETEVETKTEESTDDENLVTIDEEPVAKNASFPVVPFVIMLIAIAAVLAGVFVVKTKKEN